MDGLIILDTIDSILFFLMAASVGYLLIFAAASMAKTTYFYPLATKKYRFAVFFPSLQGR